MTADQILLTGSSGLIGTSLVRALRRKRISIISLHRRPLPGTGLHNAGFQGLWDPYAATPMTLPRNVEGTTAAVHLSGANLAGRRWNSSYKQEILESRVKPTRAIATLLAGLRPKPAVLVCASAIGIYGGRGDELLTESSLPGSGFLPEVCLAWEKATKPASDAGIRVVHLRFGVVLSPDGGALAQMLPLFRAGLGGRLGSGRQWISWVALPDAIRAIEFALETPKLSQGGECSCAQPGDKFGIHPLAGAGPSPSNAASRPRLCVAPGFRRNGGGHYPPKPAGLACSLECLAV